MKSGVHYNVRYYTSVNYAVNVAHANLDQLPSHPSFPSPSLCLMSWAHLVSMHGSYGCRLQLLCVLKFRRNLQQSWIKRIDLDLSYDQKTNFIALQMIAFCGRCVVHKTVLCTSRIKSNSSEWVEMTCWLIACSVKLKTVRISLWTERWTPAWNSPLEIVFAWCNLSHSALAKHTSWCG
jgi:hypothetical protein